MKQNTCGSPLLIRDSIAVQAQKGQDSWLGMPQNTKHTKGKLSYSHDNK